MGLNSIVKNAIQVGLNSVGDLKTKFIISSDSESFNANTASVVKSYSNTSYQGIEKDYTSYELSVSGGSISTTDKKIIFNSNNDISANDFVFIGSTKYKIIPPIKRDLTNTLYTLQIRK